jgi:hypothetical protein
MSPNGRRPRVLVVGSYVHFPGHLVSGSAAGFRALGFEVRVHDVLGFRDSLAFKLYNRARLRFRPLARAAAVRQNQRLVEAAREFRPDLCFVIRSENTTERTIRAISQTGARVVNWSVDDPYRPRTELRAAHAYDHAFVFDRHYIEALERHGVRSASYLPMGCDPQVHRPVELTPAERERYGAEVAFVGTHYPNRERALMGIRDLDLAIWGGGWKLHLWNPGHPLRASFRGMAMGEEMV